METNFKGSLPARSDSAKHRNEAKRGGVTAARVLRFCSKLFIRRVWTVHDDGTAFSLCGEVLVSVKRRLLFCLGGKEQPLCHGAGGVCPDDGGGEQVETGAGVWGIHRRRNDLL